MLMSFYENCENAVSPYNKMPYNPNSLKSIYNNIFNDNTISYITIQNDAVVYLFFIYCVLYFLSLFGFL